jgi:hypothetical protein
MGRATGGDRLIQPFYGLGRISIEDRFNRETPETKQLFAPLLAPASRCSFSHGKRRRDEGFILRSALKAVPRKMSFWSRRT